ncbi:DmsC/YnfH family molybdoenzyme membrane anchor subunit [uncultured Adlercreutzia sp.]|uniref:dimethyl sulfoxide reductase anchor subunit family protein n=1 Tax=uncultured Adlercreutzia sp. TaxID=875803 RepID=UPI0025F4B6CE|nr:DmsC/YnfH family molybdoenzyme membrane anchor subunit [uncultured Adlercreutzia sp.]
MEIQWPLILFTFFNCLAGGIFLVQGILTLAGKGKQMQLASCVSAIVALAVGGLAVFFHLQHPLRMLNGFGHLSSGITIELIFVIVFAIAVVLYFLMMRRSEEGVAPKWCAVVAIVVSLVLPFVTGESYLMAAIPVWNTMLLPIYYVVATFMLGGFAAMIIAAVTKCEDAVKLASTVAFIGTVVTAIVTIVYAVAISGMGSEYTEMEYYFDPTLPDVAMRQAEAVTAAIMTGEHAMAFWLGAVVIGCAVPAVLSGLVMVGKISADKALVVAIVAIVCAIIGTIVWRVLLYEVAVNALIQFQWAME